MPSAGGNYILDKGYNVKAGTTLVKYTAVKLTDEEEVGPVAAEGDVVLGFAQFGVTAAELLKGKGASIRQAGVTLAKVGVGGVTLGLQVVIAADGTIVAANTGGRFVGEVMQTGVEGDLVSLLFSPNLGLSA